MVAGVLTAAPAIATPDLAVGRNVFDGNCAACHQVRGPTVCCSQELPALYALQLHYMILLYVRRLTISSICRLAASTWLTLATDLCRAIDRCE